MAGRPTPFLLQEKIRPILQRRAVWRTAAYESGALLIIAAAIALGTRLLHIDWSDNQRHAIGLVIAVIPLALWVGISYRAEQRAQEARLRLPLVLGASMLVANAVGVPVVDRLFAVDAWLVNAGGLTRILGYSLIFGFVTEGLKFAVLRFTVWPDQFNARVDGIAYSLAAGLGYATMLNLNFVITESAEPAAIALRVAAITLAQAAISPVVGYWLGEFTFGNPAIFWLPIGIGVAALLQGVYIVLRGSLIVGAIGATASGSQSIAVLGLGGGMVALIFVTVSFLINNAELRAQRSPEFIR